MYEEQTANLRDACKKRDPVAAREAVSVFANALTSSMTEANDYRLLVPFAALDKEHLFSAEFNDDYDGLEVRVSTRGLLAQALETAGVTRSDEYSDRLCAVLRELHNALSLGSAETEIKRAAVLDELDTLSLAAA